VVPHISRCFRSVDLDTTTAMSFRAGAGLPWDSSSEHCLARVASSVQAGTSDTNGGTGSSSLPSGPWTVTVMASDSFTEGPPSGWCRKDGLKSRASLGIGGGFIVTVTVSGTGILALPMLDGRIRVVENVLMHCPPKVL
jgi:hypothetical protein